MKKARKTRSKQTIRKPSDRPAERGNPDPIAGEGVHSEWTKTPAPLQANPTAPADWLAKAVVTGNSNIAVSVMHRTNGKVRTFDLLFSLCRSMPLDVIRGEITRAAAERGFDTYALETEVSFGD